MSKFGILLSGALLTGCFAFAQDSAPAAAPPAATPPKHQKAHADSADKRLKRMSKKLKLTDEQKEKIRPILKDEETQVDAAEADSTLDQQQKHKKIRQIHMAARTQVDGLLTSEQKTQMPPPKAGHGGHGRRRGVPPSTPTDSGTPQ